MNRTRRGTRRPNPRPYVPPPQPLMSSQLGLQDIDLELELLKRKREIIEQQQQMLNNDRLSVNRFGEFSHMYEDRGSYEAGSSGGKKRPQVWEHESPPKRFATGDTSAPNKSYPQFRVHTKKPTSQRGGFQQQRQPGAPIRGGPQFYSGPGPSVVKKKDFKLTKVHKPSSTPPPNKLKSYSPADRRTLVTEAINSDTLTLRADRPASNQLNGRLELALGHIIKDIRAKYPEYEEQFKSNNAGRALKQALRDRLRACMMGKQVTAYGETIKIYRESFPPETDKDLLLNSFEVQMGTDFVPIESDNPQEFFTKNLGRLMTKKMEEMFNKLGEIYSNDKPTQNQSKNDATVKKNSDIIEVDDKDADVQVIERTDNKEVYDIIDIDTEIEPIKEPDENDEKYKKIMSTEEYKRLDSQMSAMLPYMLKKIAPLILKTMKLDGMYRKTFSGIKQDLRRKIMFDGDKHQTPKRPNPIQKSNVIDVDEIQNKDGEKAEISKKVYQPLPYFVKIMGRPTIPKRKAMQIFFNDYNPKSIKKHRNVHNILFVGFADKKDFDNILAADGTVIGRSTLNIKVSERSKQTLPDGDTKQNTDNLINNDLDNQITELLSSIKKSEGLIDEDEEMKPNEQEVKVENGNATNVNDNETKIDEKVDNVTKIDKDVEMPENGEIDRSGHENEATEEAVQGNNVKENNEEQGQTATENPAENRAAETEKMDEDMQNQEGINEKNENPDTVIENNVGTENKGEDITENKSDEKDNENGEKPQESKDTVEISSENKDTVSALKTEVKGTPTRSSPRLASTPSGIRTRRASKLAENNS